LERGGDSIGGIRRRFKTLERIGWLKLASEKTRGRRRSAVERFYKATRPVMFDQESWAELPVSAEPTYGWTVFKALSERVKEAVRAGTLEARLDSHFSWAILRLDQRGWEKVSAAIDELSAQILEEIDKAERRIGASDAESIAMTTALLTFESPKDPNKEP